MGMSDETKGSLIGGAVSILGSAINAGAQGNMNKKNRKWQEGRYDIQRKDALADWNMQNAYNSPEQQMERLRAAGLNPNLVYGNGATATSSQQPRSTDTGSYHGEAPRVDLQQLGNSMQRYYDIKIQKQTLSNMDAQQKVAIQDALNKAASTASIGMQTARSSFDLEMAKRLQDNTIASSNQQLEKLKADTRFTVEGNERANLSNASQIAKNAEDILRSKSDRLTAGVERQRLEQVIQELKSTNVLKQWEVELSKRGLSPHDGTLSRVLSTNSDEIIKAIKTIPNPKEFKDWINNKLANALKYAGKAASYIR